MNQIELLAGQRVGANIMALNGNMRAVQRSILDQKTWIDVRDEDLPGGAAALSQPGSNRPTPSTDFPAVPPDVDAGSFQVADGPGVVKRFQAGKTLSYLLPRIIKDVVAHGSLLLSAQGFSVCSNAQAAPFLRLRGV
jgi:hypothetical protein